MSTAEYVPTQAEIALAARIMADEVAFGSIPSREQCDECRATAREVAVEAAEAGIPAEQAVCCEMVL